MKPSTKWFTGSAAVAALIISALSIRGAGPLTPPGAPAPTMRTLDEVEPRINVATLAGDASNERIIAQPGSYYLSANVTTAKSTAISISAAGVTLDLNGFQINRSAGTGGNGISVGATAHRVTIHNGTILGDFAQGINCITGSVATCVEQVAISACTGFGILAREAAIIRQCGVHDQTGTGIQAGPAATISQCTLSNCQTGRGILGTLGTIIDHCSVTRQTGVVGIEVQSSGVITDCAVHDCTVSTAAIRGETATTISRSTAYSNDTPTGISCGNGSTMGHCSARSNTGASPSTSGISASVGSTLIECSADENLSTAATLTGTTGSGISTGSNVSVFNCTARNNTGDGIRVPGGCHVRGNTCGGNGNGTGDGAGIHATSFDNRIDGNTVTGNDRGFDLDAGGSFIVRNTAAGNATNYEIAASNAVGTIVATPASVAISGNTGGAGVGSTDPWANFSF